MRWIGLISIGLLVACASAIITPTEEDVQRVKSRYEDATLVALQDGKQLFESYCGKCHPYKKPHKYSLEEWKKILPAMLDKLEKKKGVQLNEEQKHHLELYITAAHLRKKG